MLDKSTFVVHNWITMAKWVRISDFAGPCRYSISIEPAVLPWLRFPWHIFCYFLLPGRGISGENFCPVVAKQRPAGRPGG